MATLIFERRSSRFTLWRLRTALFLSLPLLVLAPRLAPAQHIITAAERAQADALFQQAYTSYQSGDYPQAHRLMDQADKLKPNHADGWNLRGAVYLEQGKFDLASAAFSRAVALDPKLWAAQFNLAEVPFHQKDYRRARARFEDLLSQTDRFKERSRWELATFKVYLSSLLMGDDTGARKRLAKLPDKGGATPAYLYAQAALSFSRKDVATAEKTLVIARTAYPVAANDIFASALVALGWQAAAPVMPPAYGPMPPPGTGSSAGNGERPMRIDPTLEGAVAEPLPVPGGPVYAQIPSVTPHAGGDKAESAGEGAGKAKTAPNAKPASSPQKAPTLTPETGGHTELLLE